MRKGATDRTPAEHRAGLDTPLPPGERIVWQGAPGKWAMGATVFRFRLVALYLIVLMALTLVMLLDGNWPMPQAIALSILAIPSGLAGVGILAVLGALMARTSTYTLTNRRLILHIGVAYDRTISIPLSAITNARVRPRGRSGTGDIALEVKDTGGLNYINLWPHARAFFFLPPQPALRAVPGVLAVSDILGDTLVAFNTAPRGRAVAPVEDTRKEQGAERAAAPPHDEDAAPAKIRRLKEAAA